MGDASKTAKVDLVVVGGGLVGLMAALKLSHVTHAKGLTLGLVTPRMNSSDPRTTAMLMPSINMLEELNVWEAIKPKTAPLKTMRLIDGSKRLVRAPVTDFRATEMELEAFGYNVPNADMIALLEGKIADEASIIRFDGRVEEALCETGRVTLKLEDGSFVESQLTVAADGRNSILRESAEIDVKTWSYPQTALVLTFKHSLPHDHVSAEFHTETGPFTQVPLPARPDAPNRSSLVWVVTPEEASNFLNWKTNKLEQYVENKLQSCFGKVEIETDLHDIPLSGMTAKSFGQNGVALVGESGHVFPPIGAQGFNLGLRDVSELANLIECSDLDSDSLLSNYTRKRTADVALRTAGVDVMNRSLLTDFLPVQIARTMGISALGNISWLRKLAMHGGLGNGLRGALPSPASLMERGRAAVNRSR